METIKLSLSALAPTRWETHPPTGAAFEIAPLEPEKDQEITRKAMGANGETDAVEFAKLTIEECVKNWKGVGDKTGPLPCNPENRATFARTHAFKIAPWLIARARSIDHYRQEEIEAAKNA